MRKGTEQIAMVHLRPIRPSIHPAAIPEKAAPTGMRAPIQLPSLWETPEMSHSSLHRFSWWHNVWSKYSVGVFSL